MGDRTALEEDALDAVFATKGSEGDDGQGVDVHRGFDKAAFTAFIKWVLGGEVEVTCGFDFAYEDSGIGGLNLKGDDRFLERMYCFKVLAGVGSAGAGAVSAGAGAVSTGAGAVSTGAGAVERRVVVHVHTNLRWGNRHKFNLSERALEVTSVNIRHAVKEPGDAHYRQEKAKFYVVPVSRELTQGWRELFTKGRGSEFTWWWNQPGSVPALDKNFAQRYDDLRQVLRLGEKICGSFVDTRNLYDTETKIRGGVEYEVVGIGNGERIPRTMMMPMMQQHVHGQQEGVGAAGSVTVSDDARKREPEPFNGKPKILFIGVNTEGMPEISTRLECEKVRDVFMRQWGKYHWRDHVIIDDTDPSKSPGGLVGRILDLSPDIVHIACHGEDGGLLLACDRFVEDWLLQRAIGALNELGRIRLVITNSCLSSGVAEKLSNCVEFVVGHRDSLPDARAMHFSELFYGSLAEGNSLEASFHAGSGTERTSYHLWASRTDPSRMFFFSSSNNAPQAAAPQGLAVVQAPTGTGPHAQAGGQRGGELQRKAFGLESFDPDGYQPRRSMLNKLRGWRDGKSRKLAVHGQGGAGKSTLVRMFLTQEAGVEFAIFLKCGQMCQLLKEDYLELAKWLVLVWPGDAASAPTARLGELRVDADVDEVRSSVHGALRSLEGRWMVAIDDAGSKDVLEGDKEGLLKGFPWQYGRTIITSRSDEWAKLPEFRDDVHVGGFSEEEACECVRLTVKRWGDGEEDGIRELVRMLGLFPLVVRQAAVLCAENEAVYIKPEHLMTRMRGSVGSPLQQLSKRSSEYPWTLAEVISLSWQAIQTRAWQAAAHEAEEANDAAEEAKRLLRKLSLMDPEGVDVELFLGESERERVQLLKTQGLVSFVFQEESAVVQMHALTQKVIRADGRLMDGKAEEAVEGVVSDLRQVLLKYDENVRATFGFAEKVVPHALALASSAVEVVQAGGHCLTELGELMHDVARYCEDKACLFTPALSLLRGVLEIRREALGDEHVDVAATHNNMGNVYRTLGDYSKALEYHQKALDIRCKALGDEHVDVAGTCGNMGNVYRELGDYSKALEYHQKALDIRCKALGDEHVDVARTHDNMGIVYRSLGQFKQALEFHEKALKTRLKVLGDEHVDVATTCDNMGIVYCTLGDYSKALEYHQKALDIRCKALGNEHVHVATTLMNIANVYESQGKFELALQKHEESLQIKLKTLGHEHVDVAATNTNMGNVYFQRGDYSKALEYYERSLSISCKALGDEHVDVATTCDNMGIVYGTLGDYSKALEYHQKALDISFKALGNEHVDVAATHDNMGVVYGKLGDYSKALEYHQKALDIRCKALGDEHVDVAGTCDNMGNVYRELGDYSKALEYHQKALEIFCKVLGDEHVDVANTQYNMAIVYAERGEKSRAIELYQNCARIYAQVYGDDHDETRDARESASALQQDWDDDDELDDENDDDDDDDDELDDDDDHELDDKDVCGL